MSSNLPLSNVREERTKSVRSAVDNGHGGTRCALPPGLDAEAYDGAVPDHRSPYAIVDCGLCDDDGYRGFRVCDHVDRTETAARGIAAARAALEKAAR